MPDAAPPDRTADSRAGTTWELEDVYDPETLALIENAPVRARPGDDPPPLPGAGLRGPVGIGPTITGSAGPSSDPAAAGASADTRSSAPAAQDDAAPAGEADVRSGSGERRGRSGVAGLLMAGMMTGVADVMDPDRLQPEMVEFIPDQPDPAGMPVQFVYVPGSPTASRIIVRPWLFGRR